MRHPIYTGLSLLAVGSAIWVPNAITASGVALMLLGSDLRGRSKEKLLLAQFPTEYAALIERTRRFLPFSY